MSQSFFKLQATWGTIQKLWMLLFRAWRWRTNFEMLSSSDTFRVILTWFASTVWNTASEHSLGIHSFRPTWPWLIVKVLVTWMKFLFCDQLHFHISYNKCFWLLPRYHSPVRSHELCYRIRLRRTFINAAYKSHTGLSNIQYVSTPTTTRLPIAVGTFHGLHCFSHVIYALQTSVYQKIAEFLSHPSNDNTDWLYLVYDNKNNNNYR